MEAQVASSNKGYTYLSTETTLEVENPRSWRTTNWKAVSVAVGLGIAVAVMAGIALSYHLAAGDEGPSKVGAGLFLTCNGQVLLLQRQSKHNDKTWGLPGGNAEATDADLLATARREATEEMAGVPDFKVKGQILTKRGSGGQKHYTVFVCEVSSEVKAAFVPHLNEEHRAYHWFDIQEASEMKKSSLHPVLGIVFKKEAVFTQVKSYIAM